MALVGHWPLNGNADDYSGYGNHGVANSVTWVDGKIGRAGSFNGSSSRISINDPKYNLLDEGSISVWVRSNIEYPSDTTSTRFRGIVGKTTSGGVGGQAYFIDWYGTNSSRALRFGIGSSQRIMISNFDMQEWVHISMTWDFSGKLTAYVNGEIHNWINISNPTDLPDTPFEIGRTFGGNTYVWDGLLNDVRIYNHALSAKEVKKLSQGLIVHYPMDDPYVEDTVNMHPDPSLRTRTEDEELYGGSVNSATGSRYARKNKAPDAPKDSLMIELNIDTDFGGIFTDLSGSYTLEEGKTYTRSWWLKGTRNIGSISGHICSSNRVSDNKYIIGDPIPITNDWVRHHHTFTVGPGGGGEYRVRHIIYNIPQTVWIANVQIEEKDHPTPFTENTRNKEYVYDISGFKNHGIKHGNLNYSNSSLVGDGSYEFMGSEGWINLLNNNIPKENTTISFWRKTNNLISYYGWVAFGGSSSNRYMMATHSGTGNFYHSSDTSGEKRIYVNGVYAGISNVPPVQNQEWNHYVISDINFSEWTKLSISGSHDHWNMFGNVSDVRIYATALSDEDILQLYQERASFDDNGNIFNYGLDQIDELECFKVNSTGNINNNKINQIDPIDGNLDTPDIENQEYLGNGWYRIRRNINPAVTIDYNIHTKNYRLDGECFINYDFLFSKWIGENGKSYTVSYEYVSGEIISGDPFTINYYNQNNTGTSLFARVLNKTNMSLTRNNIKNIYIVAINRVFDNFIFKIRIEEENTINRNPKQRILENGTIEHTGYIIQK